MPSNLDPLSPEQIQTALSALKGWCLSDEGDKLCVEYRFKDFSEALGFITRVGLLAEQHGHHPEIFNVWSTVKLGLNTHDAGGKVTKKDTDLAVAISKLGDLTS